jgi:hypothetical protein
MSEIPKGFCQCGCGGKTRIIQHNQPSRGLVAGEPRKYMQGHAAYPKCYASQADRSKAHYERTKGDSAAVAGRRRAAAERRQQRAREAEEQRIALPPSPVASIALYRREKAKRQRRIAPLLESCRVQLAAEMESRRHRGGRPKKVRNG